MRIFSFSLMGCFIFSSWAIADVGFPDIPEIKEVNLAVEHVYIPKGFDSNDSSEIIVTGWYPNPCHEWSRAIIEKKPGSLEVQLKALLKRGMDTVCIDMAVPYMETVKLGALQAGENKLLVDDIHAKVHIEKASTGSIDDYLYGQVQSVRSDHKALILEIALPSDCLVLDRMESIFNGKDVCSVLPIMKKVKDTCPRRPEVYDYRFEIPEDCLQADKTLFHIRSLEGKAVNFLLRNR